VRLQRGSLLKPAEAIALRLLVWVPVGLLVNALVVRPLFGAAPVLEAAVMTMFVLPPPFVIPLFMREPEGADRTFVVNTLSLATLVTLVAFTVITVVYRP
jgi:malate permease and related proteins